VGKIAEYSIRIAKLREPMESAVEEGDLLAAKEVKVGPGDNNMVFGPGVVAVNNEVDGLKLSLTPERAEIGSGTVRFDSDLARIQYAGNKAMNPQIKQRPPNIVSYYPVVITLPPGILGGILRGGLGAIMTLLERMQESGHAE